MDGFKRIDRLASAGSGAIAAGLRHLLLVALVTTLAACGGGGDSAASTDTGAAPGPSTPVPVTPTPDPGSPPPDPAPSGTVAINIVLEAPATLWPGTVWMRADTAAVTRAAITRQDYSCPPGGPGNRTCTFNVPRGQTVTLVASDQQAEIAFQSTPFLQRDVDPRGIRSQFSSFSGPCTIPERGVCVVLASSDQTITIHNSALKLTRVKFLGENNWDIIVTAPPTLNVADELHTELQSAIFVPGRNAVAYCDTDPFVPVVCFTIVTSNGGSFRFEAPPPAGPPPLGASAPLAFIGFDNACGSNSACNLDGDFDQDVTMTWEYYRCGTSASNLVWNFGPSIPGPSPSTPCVLIHP